MKSYLDPEALPQAGPWATSVQQGLRRGGLPTREDYEDLLFRIEQLEHRVRMLEDRPAAPPPRAGEPEFPPERGDAPETPPGL